MAYIFSHDQPPDEISLAWPSAESPLSQDTAELRGSADHPARQLAAARHASQSHLTAGAATASWVVTDILPMIFPFFTFSAICQYICVLKF